MADFGNRNEREVVATPGESHAAPNVTRTSLRMTGSTPSTTFIPPTTTPSDSPLDTPTPEAEHHDSGSEYVSSLAILNDADTNRSSLGDDGSEFNNADGTPRPRFSSLTSVPPVASDLLNGPQKETSSEETPTPFRSLTFITDTTSDTPETPSTTSHRTSHRTSSRTSSQEQATTPEASSTSVEIIVPPRDSSSLQSPISSGDEKLEPTPQPTRSLSTTSIDPEEPVTPTPVLPTPGESVSTFTTSSQLQTPGIPHVPGRKPTIPDIQTPLPGPTDKSPIDTTLSSTHQTPTLIETSTNEPSLSSTTVSSSSAEVPAQPPPADEPSSVTLTASTLPATTAESTTISVPDAVITFPNVGDTLPPSSSSSLDTTSVLPEEPVNSLEPVQPPVSSEEPTTTATLKTTSTQLTTVPPADGSDPNFPTVTSQTATISLTPDQYQANLQRARELNEQFAASKPGPCVGNQVGCINGKFANCAGGTFDINSCPAGQACFAMPKNDIFGVSVECVSKGDAEAILKGGSATKPAAEKPVAPTNEVSSESPGNVLTQTVVNPVVDPVATTSLVASQPAAEPSPAPPPPPAADTTSAVPMFTSINFIVDPTTTQEKPARPTNNVAGEGSPPKDVVGDSTTVVNNGVPTVSVTVTKTVTEAAGTKTVTEKETITQNVTVDNVGDRVDVQHINTL